ncbi:Transcriptional regulator [Vibrio jasicida]|uniref:Transcriptional regulator n=1 Tax=Vibrio jasicida TaxID=766224 RepID=A0AAU9QUE4_9VIBR|nr:Transcriptional regulator [Vibrio jasicida]CAH1602308.1 Transcriptional regulator [Vibrio jasicida]
MNQSILFPDMQSWDEASQSVNFAAQQSGALIECYVTKQKLAKLSGSLIETEQAAIKVFTDYRFDLEEIAEELIEEEAFSDEGHIIID